MNKAKTNQKCSTSSFSPIFELPTLNAIGHTEGYRITSVLPTLHSIYSNMLFSPFCGCVTKQHLIKEIVPVRF